MGRKMSLKLDVELAVDQDDFHRACMEALGLTYQQVEDQMVEIGFFKGNGDIIFDVRYPEEDNNAVGNAMHKFLNDNGYQSIRVYEDH